MITRDVVVIAHVHADIPARQHVSVLHPEPIVEAIGGSCERIPRRSKVGTDRQRIVEAPAVIEQAYPEEAVPADVLKLDACTEILMLRQRTARADLEVRRCRCRGGS